MHRRSFLTLLGAVGVLTGAPKWLLDPIMREKLAPNLDLPADDDVSQWLEPTDLAVYGRQQTFEFCAAHNGDTNSGRAVVKMLRLPEDGGGTILEFPLLPGGFVRWVAGYGEEIYGPVRIVSPEIIQAHVIGTDSLGRIVMASKNGVIPMRPY